MMQPRDRVFHVERARAELDAAYRAERSAIADIHLRLCALHMEQARAVASDDGSDERELELSEGFAPRLAS